MTNDPSPEKDEGTPDKKRIRFHFLKGNSFRSIYVDGAIGAVGPSGEVIHMAVFSERVPIPLQHVHEVDDAGHLRPPSERTGRDGVVREVEADLIMTAATAKNIVDWLNKRIAEIEARQERRRQ